MSREDSPDRRDGVSASDQTGRTGIPETTDAVLFALLRAPGNDVHQQVADVLVHVTSPAANSLADSEELALEEQITTTDVVRLREVADELERFVEERIVPLTDGVGAWDEGTGRCAPLCAHQPLPDDQCGGDTTTSDDAQSDSDQ